MQRRDFLWAAGAALAGCGGGGEDVDVHVFSGTSAGTGVTLPVQYTPDNAAFSYSDYCAASVTSARARFTRPTVDGQGLESTNPGARVRFITDAASVQINLQYTNLVTLVNYEGTGLVLANGVIVGTFTRPAGPAGPLTTLIDLGSTALRTIELVMPYSASVDFLGIALPAGSALLPATARSSVRYVAAGDSITQGFYAGTIATQWNYALAAAKGYQLINHGYGGRLCVPADGTAAASFSPTVASYLIGYNDFAAQLALATFKANYIAFINNFRAVNPTAKLYCITPIYTTTVLGIVIESYRQQIRDALTSLANSKNVLVEGPSLFTNNSNRLQDGIHPNDLGSAEFAASMNSILVP